MKLELYCTCGAAWVFEASGFQPHAMQTAWDEEHCGPGHEPADAATAARARAKAEREEAQAQ